jgi:hypothetical protein
MLVIWKVGNKSHLEHVLFKHPYCEDEKAVKHSLIQQPHDTITNI